MPAPTLEDFVESLPTVLSSEEAFAALDTLLQRAEADTDDSTEMAQALGEVVFHFSDSYSELDSARETRLRHWIEGHWRTEPVQAFGALFNLLANMPSQEVTDLLDAKRTTETDPTIVEMIDRCLASRAAAVEQNRRSDEEAKAAKAADEERAAREIESAKDAEEAVAADARRAADRETAAALEAKEGIEDEDQEEEEPVPAAPTGT